MVLFGKPRMNISILYSDILVMWLFWYDDSEGWIPNSYNIRYYYQI